MKAGKRSRLHVEENRRDSCKTRLDDLTSSEIGPLLNFSAGANEEIQLNMRHPRVYEHPYYGDLIAYLLGQIKIIQETKAPNLYQSDRFTGLTTFLTNITSLFHPDPGRDYEKLPLCLHSNEELNRRLVAMTIEYFLKELPDEDDGLGERPEPDGKCSREQKLVKNVANLLTVLHHFISFEARLEASERYVKQERISAS